jgi:hypothetical protein
MECAGFHHLAATTRKGEGIPYLDKAKSFGVVNADYWLGWSCVSVGEKTKAIENLENYTKRVPGDQNRSNTGCRSQRQGELRAA